MGVAPRVSVTEPEVTLSDYLPALVMQATQVKAKMRHLTLSPFFPSKIGGKPAWLVPESLPTDLTCGRCGGLCSFLLQIYAENEESAKEGSMTTRDAINGFHRILFMFACHSCGDFFRVFRSQLPLVNAYYGKEALDRTSPPSEGQMPPMTGLCARCGLPTHGECHVHMYPEFFLDFDDVWVSEDTELSAAELQEQLAAMEGIPTCMGSQEEDDIVEIAGRRYGETWQNFVEKYAGNVGMYWRGGKALWLMDCDEDGGRCGRCEGRREFEFQLLPGLIDRVKALENLDFAVVAAFTCGCQIQGYVEEKVVVQKEPETWWRTWKAPRC